MNRAHLNRDHHARQALFKGLIKSLVAKESLETTRAKAKAVRSIFEKLLTRSQLGTLAARRYAQSVLQDSSLVTKLVDDIAKRYSSTKGGYTTVKPLGTRRGDRAPLVRLALTKQAASTAHAAPKSAKATSKKSPRTVASPALPRALAPAKPTQKSVSPASGRIGMRQGER